MLRIVSDLHSLKNASAAEMIAKLSDLSQQHQGLAAQIRGVFGGGGNGRRESLPRTVSDAQTVLVGLLAVLLDEISYAPSANIRASQVKEVESACERLNLNYDEVVQCSRRAAKLTEIFEAQ